MGRKATLEDIANVRKENEERNNAKPFLFLRDGDTLDIEAKDQTFTFISEDEEGLDGRTVNWDQYQISVIDCNDNRVKTFKPNKNCVNNMWSALEEQNLDPLNFKGRVFKITREGYEHLVQIVNGGAMIHEDEEDDSGDVEVEANPDMEDAVREAVRSVLESHQGKKVKSKELRQWVEAYLLECDIRAPMAMIVDILEEEQEK